MKLRKFQLFGGAGSFFYFALYLFTGICYYYLIECKEA